VTPSEPGGRFRYACRMRWGDMDAQGHINNASYLDYLQEARVDFLLSGAPVLQQLLDTGVLVVAHQVEYLRPVSYSADPLQIELWVDSVGGSRFSVGYDVLDGGELAARARTVAVPFDLASNALRRLTAEERTLLSGWLDPSEPLRALPPVRLVGSGHRDPLAVRWSDLDSYGHVNNVKFFDYIQQARIALMAETVEWGPEDVWSLVRQDLEYRRPLDFRREPYEVVTAVTDIGNRSFRLAAEIRDPTSGSTYATSRSIVVGSAPLSESARAALASWAVPSREDAAGAPAGAPAPTPAG
jgi:acyl-CoA thioester hydrolase